MTTTQQRINKLEAEGFALATTLTALLMGGRGLDRDTLSKLERLRELKTEIEALEARS